MKNPSGVMPEAFDLHNPDEADVVRANEARTTEPHVDDAIQPHGLLFVICETALVIQAVSANCTKILGRSAQELLGQPVASIVYHKDVPALVEMLHKKETALYHPIKMRCLVGDTLHIFDAIIHFHHNALIMELEPTTAIVARAFVAFYHESRVAVNLLRQASDLKQLCAATAGQIRNMTGFDRVCIYRFDANWNGQVICEERNPKITSFLDYYFPESDIPQQARELHRVSHVQSIPDTQYKPSPLIYGAHLTSIGQPVDLSMAVLRSVSPRHGEYARHMGIRASMSIPLVHEDRLWGLLICVHEGSPLNLSYDIRTACEFLCQIMTSLIGMKEANTERAYRQRLKHVNAALLETMLDEQDIIAGLSRHTPNMVEVCAASGAAICMNTAITTIGNTPTVAQIEGILRWLSDEGLNSQLYSTDSLPNVYAPARAFKQLACGLMAAPLSSAKNSFLLWFRPESRYVRTWGSRRAKPDAAMQGAQPSGTKTNAPPPYRQSSEFYTQTMLLKGVPWETSEEEAAVELVGMVVDVMLQNSESLQSLNRELLRSNVELDAFAYAASHDLKEPLRGIRAFVTLAMKELGDTHLVGESRFRLQAVLHLTQRMQKLIDGLLRYAYVDRTEICLRTVDLNEVMSRINDTLQSRLSEKPTSLYISAPLPCIKGDQILIEELFTNLITNAIKYNDKSDRWVRVKHCSVPESDSVEIHISDNGIGISPKHYENIFKIFRRLHSRNSYGGGSGAGLTIAKRIVERHGGVLHVDSKLGEGTTFSFVLKHAVLSESATVRPEELCAATNAKACQDVVHPANFD